MSIFDALLRLVGAAAPSSAPRPRASLDGSAPQTFPYDAAAWTSQEMGDWLPWLRSPDSEINVYRDRMVARARDLVRNDGWASGAIGRILDSTIGASYRLSSIPDYRVLALHDPAFDADWAAEFQSVAEALWRTYSEDIGRWNDVGRRLTVSQQFRQLLGHKLVDGEALAVCYWLPERIGRGGATYATAWEVVDPDRLSNPYQMVDSRNMRGGVEIDDFGAPLAYHIRRAHQNDWYNAVESMQWERVLREDDDGWRRVIHDFEAARAGQHRGVSIFAPILARMKMLARYYGVELQAATLASVFGTYVVSPFDGEMVEDKLINTGVVSAYQRLRMDWDKERPAMLNGVRIPTLAPGEDIRTVAAERPNTNFSPFTHEMLRSVAAVLGVSPEQVHHDYSETNYSSLRAGVVEAEKTYTRRLLEFNGNVATPWYANWLGEAMNRGELPLPRNAPAFEEARTAYARSRWLGAARGWFDPVAERQGAILGLDAGFSTLEQECAKQGLDWEENVQQRAREVALFKELGLSLPDWGGREISSSKAADKSEAE